MKKGFLLSSLLFLVFLAESQINKNGLPFVTNYTTSIYEASEQNWSIVQDKRGVMYFGNNSNGVLEYDGVNWRKISIPNSSIVRSLAVDSNGVVYVGVVNDFGYLLPTINGQLVFKSLKNKIDSSKCDFSDIWNTHSTNSGIFFVSEKYIFQYTNNELHQFEAPLGTVQSFNIDNQIYIANFNLGLLVFNQGKCTLVKGGDFFANKGIYTLNKVDDNLLVGTFPEGLFYLNPQTGEIQKGIEKSEANTFLQNNQLYPSCNNNSSTILFGTIQNGAIWMNKQGNILQHINKKNGLQDETVIEVFIDRYSNSWLALNNGLSKIEQQSPFKLFNDNQGINGYVTDICTFNDHLFVATSIGVFYLDYNNGQELHFTELRDIAVNTWSLLPLEQNGNNQLLVGTPNGLFKVDKNFKVEFIDNQILKKDQQGKVNYIQKLYQSKSNPNLVYVAMYNGVFSIQYHNNCWERKSNYDVKEADIRQIFEDQDGNVWFATYMNGLVKSIKGNPNNLQFYTTSDGIPNLNEICIGQIDNRIAIGTKNGFYFYNEKDNRFFKDSLFSDLSGSVYFFNQDKHGNVWISVSKEYDKWITLLKKDTVNQQYIEYRTPFRRLPNEQTDVIYHDNKLLTWLGSSSGLRSYDQNKEIEYNLPFNALIRKVSTKNDSVLFEGTYFTSNIHTDTIPGLKQPEAMIPVIDYLFNDLTFEFAAPFFIEEQKTVYSYKLDGFNSAWSTWKNEPKAVFTNLSEGTYTFSVKAKNIYGFESSVASYSFTIMPPLYRTIWAFILYGIIGLIIIIFIVKIYTHRLKQEKIRLEQIVMERTTEIRKQNEVLEIQKAEILEQKEEITASIKYAQRIQKAIVPNSELADSLLKDYFLLWKPRDIVSGDFWWLGEKNGYVVATAADCTGHGVPGAFMSMLGVSFLNEVVKQQDITQSNEILNRLREKVKSTLGQNDTNSESKDGMDMALLVIDYKNMKAQFSGAYNPLYQIRNGKLIETKATRNPIAIFIKETPFEANTIDLQKGDTLYLFSDGFTDQFNGDTGKKYSSKRFKEFLVSIQEHQMNKQKQLLDNEIEAWKNGHNQIDDIIILGIRI